MGINWGLFGVAMLLTSMIIGLKVLRDFPSIDIIQAMTSSLMMRGGVVITLYAMISFFVSRIVF